jgi:chromate transport protein ChrA
MTLWEMLAQIALANLLSFGNGTVMAAVLQNSFVQQERVLTNEQLLYALALARVTPGQANLFVASIAYMLFGLPGAALSIVAIAAPSLLMIWLLRSYELVRGNAAVYGLTRGLASTAVGLLLTTTWHLGGDSLSGPLPWAVFGLCLVLLLFTRLPTLISLLIAVSAGVAVLLGTSAR